MNFERYHLQQKLEEQNLIYSQQNSQNLPINSQQSYFHFMEKELFPSKKTQPYQASIQAPLFLGSKFSYSNKPKFRQISTSPFKVLDACYLQDDFYINVLDWSKGNSISIGLNNIVYQWNFVSQEVFKVFETSQEQDEISSVSHDLLSNSLILSTNFGTALLFDEQLRQIRSFRTSQDRVGVSSLRGNQLLLGDKLGRVFRYDIRQKSPVHIYEHHSQEVCGLKWSPNGEYFASGGNENKLLVHSTRIEEPIFHFKHKAAVRAIGWSTRKPKQLATGAGTADRKLRLFDMNKMKLEKEKETGSQICSLAFSPISNELYTSHGFSENEINIWDSRSLEKKVSLKAHTARVLFMALSPDGNVLASGAGDETLRFWDLNLKKEEKKDFFLKSDI